jgi:tetratricopeptide (TPR) repeat protein
VWLFTEQDVELLATRIDEVADPNIRGAARSHVARRRGLFELAVAAAPDPSDLSVEAGWWHYHRGLAETLMERYDASLVSLNAAKARWRSHDALEFLLFGALGYVLVQLGRLAEAEDALTPLLEGTATDQADAHVSLGFVARARGDVEGTLVHARAARDLGSQLRPAVRSYPLQNAAEMFRDVGDTDAARSTAIQALRLDVNHRTKAHLHFVLGAALLEAGELDEAVIQLDLADVPASGARLRSIALVFAGFAHELAGRPTEAQRVHDRTRALLPPGPSRAAFLLDALSPAPTDLDGALAFARAHLDVGLLGAVAVAQGRAPGEAELRCGFETRLAVRLATTRGRRVTLPSG